MAKECAVCGKTISLFEKSVKLKYAGAHLCNECGAEAENLFNEVDKLPEDSADAYLAAVKTEFYGKVFKSGYSTYVRSLLRDELLFRISARLQRKTVIRKYFRADFETSASAIHNAALGCAETFLKTEPVEVNGVKQQTYIFEKLFLRSESYTGLHVELLTYAGVSVITVIGAGGGNGYANVDWGTEKDFVRDFWSEMREKNYSFMQKEIDIEDPNNVKLDASLARTNRIGVLGGTFDPIHLGHKALGEAALREGGIDKLIVMPARVQPFKQGKKSADGHHRFEMCRLTFEGNEKVEISDYELNNESLSYTYDTLKFLQDIYPDQKLCFILGTDSYLKLEDWYKGLRLLENFSFIVGDRPGYREAELDEAIKKYLSKYGTETIKITADMPDISATEIREALKADNSAAGLITEAVERYIKENGLYN